MVAATIVPLRRRGRPLRMAEGRPQRCPHGHPGRVIFWGRRHWTRAPFRRQRMRCYPSDGSPIHTFSLGHRQNEPHHRHGEDCPTCDVRPGPVQGPVALVDFFLTVNEAARLLQLVGRGVSLRRASETVRLEAHRYAEDALGMRYASREFELAARYLDVLGGEIDRTLAPKAWPRILVLDSTPFNLRAYGAEEHGERWNEEDRAGAVLVAVGGDDPALRLQPWRIGFAGDETTESWRDFLDELPGDPEWIVADGAGAIASAVQRTWPNATFYSCEFHLGRALREAAYADGIYPEAASVRELFRRAFWSEADWDALATWALDEDHPELLRWMATNDDLIRRQAALHKAHFGFPRSNGAAERVCDWIDRRFPRRRRYSVRNAKRLGAVLALMRAELANQADLLLYARLVKRCVEALPAEFHVAWTALQDPSEGLCSIAALLIGARDRARRNTAGYMADAKTRSVLRLLEGENEARVSCGLPPLVATIKPGRRTLAVDVAGLMLADFPSKLLDWDLDANPGVDPCELPAGSGYAAHWKCCRCGHTWEAPVNQRTKRLTRCGRCHTERADGLNSLATVHPDLVREWDAEANAPLRPERIKASHDKTVIWRCLEDPEHPSYRMSPFARAKVEIGCPICRKRRRAAERRERRRAA